MAASTASATWPPDKRTAIKGHRQIQWNGCQLVGGHDASASRPDVRPPRRDPSAKLATRSEDGAITATVPLAPPPQGDGRLATLPSCWSSAVLAGTVAGAGLTTS